MADPRIRQITIKTGVVKRIAKEKISYEKEVLIEEKRLETKTASGADEHEKNKQIEVINECRAMIPDTKNRCKRAINELREYLEKEKDLAENAEYKQAKVQLTEAEKVLNEDDTQQACA